MKLVVSWLRFRFACLLLRVNACPECTRVTESPHELPYNPKTILNS